MEGLQINSQAERVRAGTGQETKDIKSIRLRESIISNVDVAERAESYLESRSENVKDFALRENALHNRFWPKLDHGHESYKAVDAILGTILDRAGLPRDIVELEIFNSSVPDAHIQMIARKVRLSTAVLKAVGGNGEKIASILAHEIGHILLAHYENRETSYDPLNERLQGYETEYQADRASTILLNRIGVSPHNLSDTLRDLENYSIAMGKRTPDEEGSDSSYYMEEYDNQPAWFLSTHPHTSRRAAAVKRDTRSLPSYKKRHDFDDVAIPVESDFPVIPLKDWSTDDIFWNFSEFVDDNKKNPDCLWEELGGNDYGLPTTIINKHARSIDSDPIEATPDEVNTWGQENTEKLSEWWIQALKTLDTTDGYEDLRDEVMQYSPEVIRGLLMQSSPEYEALYREDRRYSSKNKDITKSYTINTMLYDTSSHSGTPAFLIVSSVLTKALFENEASMSSPAGIKDFLMLLRQYKSEHGIFLPCSNARLMKTIEETYGGLGEEEKAQLMATVIEFRHEICGGNDSGRDLVKRLMRGVITDLEAQHPEQYFVKDENLKGVDTRETSDVAAELRQLRHGGRGIGHQPTKEEIQEGLRSIPYNYRPINLSTTAFSSTMELFDHVDKHGRPDILLESDPMASADMLSTDEFEEKYFGEGRDTYEKSEYAALDNNISEFKDAAELWEEAGFKDDFESMEAGWEKLHFLMDTLRVRSSHRDTLIADSLAWSKVEYAEDILNLQETIYVQEDISLLLALKDAFSNPLLSLAVGERLWEIYNQNPEQFWESVPEEEKERVADSISSVFENDDEQLKAILTIYSQPSYVRDELLRPLVDAAPNQESSFALASWYCEPPPGVLQPRSGEIVAVSESLIEVVRGMPQLNKQELFLYFLGQRFFYSGIDAKFFPSVRENADLYRKAAIYQGEQAFRGTYFNQEEGDEDEGDDWDREPSFKDTDEYRDYLNARLPDGDEPYDYAPEDNTPCYPGLAERYMVEKPDSLVFLTKATGVPVELLLQQQRLTTTRREQREFIENLLLGNGGILLEGDKSEFLSSVARNVVENSTWSDEQSPKQRQVMSDFLGFALDRCPDERLPDLFLGLWNLQQEKGSLPEVVTTLLRELGPVFIKGGQYLATQSNALPPDWIHALRQLSDRNQRAEKTLVYEHEHAVFGEKSPYKSIGEKLGEGSMAAVYKASDGERDLALKVYHPRTADDLPDDILFLNQLVGYVNENRDHFGVTLPENLAEVVSTQMMNELSYEQVLSNNDEMQSVVASSGNSRFSVPAVDREMSRPGFIAAKYSDGVTFDSLTPENEKVIKGEVAVELLRQILFVGTYQGDPGIGNFKVRNVDGKLLVDWLDTDHLGRLDEQERTQLRGLIMQVLVEKSPQKVAESLSLFIENNGSEVNPEIAGEIADWLQETNMLATTSLDNVEDIMTSYLDFLAERKLVLKESFVTLLRALGLMKPLLSEVNMDQITPLMMKMYQS